MAWDGARVMPASEQAPGPYVFRNVAAPLSSTPRYRDIPEISRFTPPGCPFHVAVHMISEEAEDVRRDYCAPHSHPFGEICLLIGEPGQLAYTFHLGGDDVDVESPATIWQPPGLVHAANLRRGSGTFVAIYLGRETAEEAP